MIAVHPTDANTLPRLLLVQHAGDYRDAYKRLANDGEANYYAQAYSVAEAGELAKKYAAYGVVCLTGSPQYDELMPNGVRAFGAGLFSGRFAVADLATLLADFRPTHLVVTTPWVELLRWGLANRVEVLPQFADSFAANVAGKSHIRQRFTRWRHGRYLRRLADMLRAPEIRWVSNHNVNACREIVGLGVDPGKVVPWDWPPVVRPADHAAKSPQPGGRVRNLVFVGAITPSKGVGDVIAAVAELRRRGVAVRARIIGRGDVAPFVAQANSTGVADAVDFAGPLPHPEVLTALRGADIVLVPSWHCYPEGVPMTIYEALATRTPLVCSDHPAFRGRVGAGDSTVCVPERSPAAIADAVAGMLADPDRYRRMSEATAGVWAGLVCPATYYDVIRRWVSNSPEDDAWLAAHSIQSGRYNSAST